MSPPNKDYSKLRKTGLFAEPYNRHIFTLHEIFIIETCKRKLNLLDCPLISTKLR